MADEFETIYLRLLSPRYKPVVENDDDLLLAFAMAVGCGCNAAKDRGIEAIKFWSSIKNRIQAEITARMSARKR